MINFLYVKSLIKWQSILLVVLLLAILFHFLLFLKPFEEIYSLSVPDIPLLAAIVVCGVPLLFQIVRKLFKGDFGADLLAAIAIITATYLEEYLAASLVLL